jgi:hypothetical protein
MSDLLLVNYVTVISPKGACTLFPILSVYYEFVLKNSDPREMTLVTYGQDVYWIMHGDLVHPM